MGTLGNTFGRGQKEYGSGKNIWHEVKGSYPVGGSITNISSFKGKVIPSGSMCVLDQSAHTITIVKASEIKTATQTSGTVEPSTIKGLLYHDVYVENDTTYATGNVVFAGEVYADRLEEEVPAEVWAVLPMIVPIHEA
ncbi:hypothetical protein [uncultured Parabacteroides sp.]|uniref:hypothetical protein n=1 Tax=uncultured Parabacteroides sp. TaxID=512312 RepID=UPI0025DDF0D8|nr:hypothetical protein [uncultured Parabacteroides sp.]